MSWIIFLESQRVYHEWFDCFSDSSHNFLVTSHVHLSDTWINFPEGSSHRRTRLCMPCRIDSNAPLIWECASTNCTNVYSMHSTLTFVCADTVCWLNAVNHTRAHRRAGFRVGDVAWNEAGHGHGCSILADVVLKNYLHKLGTVDPTPLLCLEDRINVQGPHAKHASDWSAAL